MIGLSLIRRTGSSPAFATCVSTLWNGRSVESLSVGSVRAFSTDQDDDAPLPAHLLPKDKPSEPPHYLKRGSRLEVAWRSAPKNDDPRTEEEREKEFWDKVEKMAAKGLILTAEQAAKAYPDSPYFKKKK